MQLHFVISEILVLRNWNSQNTFDVPWKTIAFLARSLMTKYHLELEAWLHFCLRRYETPRHLRFEWTA